MKRKFEIPKMSNEDIKKWYETIKPILRARYLRELADKELTNIAYTWLDKSTDFAEEVDFTKLSVLADVKMLHGYGYWGYFKPSVGEVIRQIPKEYLEKAVAFEILVGAIGGNDLFNDELNAGFHVSIVRLYQTKDSSNDMAKMVEMYPNKDSRVPVGMTEKEFHSFKRTCGQED